jgi:phosphoglycolate phosphatase
MRPTILLYDIDGTLISSSGAGRRAMERAFRERTGRGDLLDFPFDGMTDKAIVREGLRRADGREPAEKDVGEDEAALERRTEELLAAYLVALRDEAERCSQFRIHAGIEQALALTAGRRGYAVGLGTGNVRAGAAIKLGRVGLYDHFAFGGFGCDHIDRGALLGIGAERGAEALGVPRAECRVVVIGDTPKDIRAAQAIGAECIAVATGSFTVEALAAHEPRYVFDSLAAEGAQAALLAGRAPDRA